MNFLSCEYFVAIYRAGSIRKAAGELFITQQALSGQLNKLERELGIQLMLRTTPVELTEAGEQFLLAATRILYIRDTLLKNLEQRRSRQSEEVRVGILSSGAPIYFSDFLADFKERNPQYQVQVVELDEPTGVLRELPAEVPLAMGTFPGGGKLTHVPIVASEQFTVTVHDRLLERSYGPGWQSVAQELAAEGGLRTLKLCPFVLKRVNSSTPASSPAVRRRQASCPWRRTSAAGGTRRSSSPPLSPGPALTGDRRRWDSRPTRCGHKGSGGS